MNLRAFKQRVRRYIKRDAALRKGVETLVEMLLKRHETVKTLEVRVAELQAQVESYQERGQRAAGLLEASLQSGFYELRRDLAEHVSRPFLVAITERQASDSIDMADCYEGGAELLYLTDDGDLLPVTVGDQTRMEPDDRGEMPFHFATAPLIAGGEVRGYVTFTDH